MTMTKQHFELVADVINEAEIHTVRGGEFMRQFIAKAFAMEAAMINPRFNRERFLKACNVEE